MTRRRSPSASGVIRQITARDTPKRLAERAAASEEKLKRALRLAFARSSRSSAMVRALFRSAVVAGMAPRGRVKAAVISFRAPPFTGGLHQFWGWHQLEALSDREIASWVSLGLRSELRRRVAKGGSSRNP